jgi:membrane-associated phospholipid phosphatase
VNVPAHPSNADVEPRARTLAYARGAALSALAVFAVLAAFAWHSSHAMSWERPLMDALENRAVPLRGFWIGVFEPIPFALIVAALFALAYARGRPRLAWAGAAGCLGAVVAAELVLKPLIDRVREHGAGAIGTHVLRVAGPMFPSAHTTAAAAGAMFAWLIFGRRPLLAPLFALVPFAVGCSVIAARVHYPADAVGGILLGASLVYLAVDLAGAHGPTEPAVEPTAVEDARERARV